MIKTADGKYFVSEEGSGESTAWIETDYILSNLHWRNLLMTDTPSNASNRRQPESEARADRRDVDRRRRTSRRWMRSGSAT